MMENPEKNLEQNPIPPSVPTSASTQIPTTTPNPVPMKALFIVVNAGFVEEVIKVAREAGIMGATILHARGEGAHHELFMGISVDTEKEIIVSIADEDTAEKAMAAIKEKAGINTPAHSISFTLPVEKTVGILPTENQ